jgi:integrase
VKLTDATVKALQAPPPGRQDMLWDATLPGFGIRVSPGGTRTWLVLYRHGRNVRRLKLGRYPLMSLADARDRAKEALAAVVRGDDPAGEKQAEREAATFGEVAEAFVADAQTKGRRSWREVKRTLEHDVLPMWRTRLAKDISARDVRELLDGIVAREAPIQANRTFAIIRRLFNWAAAPDRAYVPQFHNPCRGLERPARETQRDRVLNADELRAVWKALDVESVANAAVFKLLLLTAQRVGEVRTIRWADLDLNGAWWTIPAERAKNRLAHRVPLSAPAVAILRQLRELNGATPFVFPTTRGSESGCLERVYKTVDRIRKASGVTDFTPHDLRRTAASWMTSVGISRLTVSKLLNHIERGVTAVYDRHSYDKEKQEAVNAWAAKLQKIITGAHAKVVPFRA